MTQTNQTAANSSKLSISFFSQNAVQGVKQPVNQAVPAGRVRRNKKNLGFKVDNSN